jgi:drug/metabolite transporter (DMT)-like permease
MRWPILSLITAVMFSIAYTLTSYVDKHNEVNNIAWTTSIHLIGVIIIILLLPFKLPYRLSDNIVQQTVGILTKPMSLAITLALGLCMFASEVCLFNSLNMAPNPGLPTTVSNYYIIVLVLLSYMFYDMPISMQQIAGIALALFSLHLIST